MPTPAELMREMKGETSSFDKSSKEPPANDVCPICFAEFAVPCKTNCGHWFCGRCILQLWSYGAAGQRCNCPMCSSLITKLSPEASLLARQESECVLVLKEVQQYNSLFAGDWKSFFLKTLAFPFFIGQLFRQLRDMDRVVRYVVMQAISTLLEFVLQILYLFDFISDEVMKTLSLLSFWGNILTLILLLVLGCYVFVHWIRERRFAPHRLHQDLPANL